MFRSGVDAKDVKDQVRGFSNSVGFQVIDT
jgi:hypothetical protein